MSGHSKWSTIKHQKGANDAKRGALFTRLSRDITMAASEGGGDPEMNFALRLGVEKAKAANMPKDNIERAIKKGTGELESESIVRITYEAYGPQGSALLVDCVTDNTNRTVSEVKRILEMAGAKFAQMGSVSWQFEEKGLTVVMPTRVVKSEKFGQAETYENMNKDELMLELMDIPGVEDVRDEGEVIELICIKTQLQQVYHAVQDKNIKVQSSELIKIAKDEILLTPENKAKLDALTDNLEEQDDVSAVWVNVKA